MIHLGDITKINGAEIEPVDCITAGSPCQDLSVAGKRAGLEGERSGLFMEQIRIIKEMREHDRNNGRTDEFIRPRYMVWENVPGAFSSNKGEDFRCVLEETAKVAERNAVIPGPPKGKWSKSGAIMGDGWSIAWRVHDAQFWGVPQRRKRIALVADFGGESAPEILFERKGMSGNTTESGEERQRAAKDAEGCVGETISFQERAGKPGGGKGILIQNERTGALSTLNNQPVCYRKQGHPQNAEQGQGWEQTDVTCLNDQGGSVMSVSENVVGALRAQEHGHQPIVFEPGAASRVGGHVYEDKAGTVRANAGDNQQAVVYGISAYESNAMKSANPHSGVYEADTARTLDLNGGSPACNQGGMAVVCLEGNGSRPSHQGDWWHEGDPMYTLNSTEHHAVAVENHPNDSRVKISEDGKVQTLSSRMGTGGGNVPMVMEQQEPVVLYNNQNNAGISQNGICNTLPASAGMGGGYVPMVVEPEKITNGAQRMPDKDNFNEVVQSMETFHCTNEQDKVQTLKARDYKDPQIVAYGLDRAAYNQGQNAKFGFSIDEEKVGAQTAKGPGAVCSAVDCRNGVEDADKNGSLQSRSSNNINSNNVCRVGSVVRRLTPLECERLQGFPDYWTNIGEWIDSKGKKHKGESDSPRYKALGNSIALPFWFYLLRRISAQYERPATLGSLFDGIGGFPLCWERCNGKGTARWASEIEEFPIAVTKHWFG